MSCARRGRYARRGWPSNRNRSSGCSSEIALRSAAARRERTARAGAKRWPRPAERRSGNPIEEGGPRIRGNFLTLDVHLYEDAIAALELIALQGMHRAALVRADLGDLEDALVRAMRERIAKERARGER